MTAQSWRELAIERIARAQWHEYPGINDELAWEEIPEASRNHYRGRAASRINALGDLAPTEAEERRCDSPFALPPVVPSYERRFVTAWQPIPDDQPVDLCAALQGSLDAVKAEQSAHDGEVTR